MSKYYRQVHLGAALSSDLLVLLIAAGLAEAIPLYERTLADSEQALGETHPDT